jgi:hypothetical protein
MNSWRVDGLSRKHPNIRLVTSVTPCLCTPRVVMHCLRLTNVPTIFAMRAIDLDLHLVESALGRPPSNAIRNLYSWNARGGVDLAFVSAAASESDAAKFHIRSVAENAGGTLGRSMPLGCLWRSERRLGDHARQFDRCNTLARRTWVQNSRLEFKISQAPPNILFKRAARKSLRQRGRRR